MSGDLYLFGPDPEDTPEQQAETVRQMMKQPLHMHTADVPTIQTEPSETHWLKKSVSLGGLGILTKADIEDLNKGVRLVYELMRDGEWHTADKIRLVAGGSEGLRRMRELRKHYDIEKKRGASRLWLYRLTEKKR